MEGSKNLRQAIVRHKQKMQQMEGGAAGSARITKYRRQKPKSVRAWKRWVAKPLSIPPADLHILRPKYKWVVLVGISL